MANFGSDEFKKLDALINAAEGQLNRGGDILKKVLDPKSPLEYEIVPIETFLYSKDFLGLEIKLSDKQMKFLNAIESGLYRRAVLQWGKGSIAGETIIGLEGRTIEDYCNQQECPVVISYDEKIKKFVETYADIPFIEGEDKLYDVELENGIKITVTLDHKFLTKDGWKELRDIKENEEIFTND